MYFYDISNSNAEAFKHISAVFQNIQEDIPINRKNTKMLPIYLKSKKYFFSFNAFGLNAIN